MELKYALRRVMRHPCALGRSAPTPLLYGYAAPTGTATRLKVKFFNIFKIRGETGGRLGCFGFVRFRLHKIERNPSLEYQNVIGNQ